METTLSLPGISLFYCIVCCIGLILMYFILPETENRTLEDIELHFSDNSKKITDHKITKSKCGGNKQDDVEHADGSMKKSEDGSVTRIDNGNLAATNGYKNYGFEPELSLELECSKM